MVIGVRYIGPTVCLHRLNSVEGKVLCVRYVPCIPMQLHFRYTFKGARVLVYDPTCFYFGGGHLLRMVVVAPGVGRSDSREWPCSMTQSLSQRLTVYFRLLHTCTLCSTVARLCLTVGRPRRCRATTRRTASGRTAHPSRTVRRAALGPRSRRGARPYLVPRFQV